MLLRGLSSIGCETVVGLTIRSSSIDSIRVVSTNWEEVCDVGAAVVDSGSAGDIVGKGGCAPDGTEAIVRAMASIPNFSIFSTKD